MAYIIYNCPPKTLYGCKKLLQRYGIETQNLTVREIVEKARQIALEKNDGEFEILLKQINPSQG